MKKIVLELFAQLQRKYAGAIGFSSWRQIARATRASKRLEGDEDLCPWFVTYTPIRSRWGRRRRTGGTKASTSIWRRPDLPTRSACSKCLDADPTPPSANGRLLGFSWKANRGGLPPCGSRQPRRGTIKRRYAGSDGTALRPGTRRRQDHAHSSGRLGVSAGNGAEQKYAAERARRKAIQRFEGRRCLLATYELDRTVRCWFSFGRLTANLVLGNTDAHAKNYSLLHDATGAVSLSPLYAGSAREITPRG